MAREPSEESSQPPNKVLIVDDQETVRAGLTALLRHEGFAVSTAQNGQEALDRSGAEDFDAILLDLWMPDMDGLEVLRELKRRGCRAEVIVLTSHGTIPSAVNALKLGALDYLLKPWTVHDLGSKIAHAVSIRRHAEKGVLQQAFETLAQEAGLTPKQIEVCERLLAGLSNARIAETMSISEHTVKTHLKKILQKLGVDSRTEIIAKVLKNLKGA